MPTKTEIVSKYKESEKERIESYKQAFTSEAGSVVLADLRERFYDTGLLSREQPHLTHYNLGLRDAVRYIIETLADNSTNE